MPPTTSLTHIERAEAIERLRQETHEQLARLRAERLASATRNREQLSQQLDNMRHDVATMLVELETNRQTVSEAARQDRAETYNIMRHQVAALLSDLEIGRQMVQVTQRDELNHYMDMLRTNVGTLLHTMHSAHEQMAEAGRAERAEAIAALRADVAQLLEQASANRQDLHAAQREELAAAMNKLHQDVARLMQHFEVERALRHDRTAAHAAPAAQPAAPAAPAAKAAPAAAAAPRRNGSQPKAAPALPPAPKPSLPASLQRITNQMDELRQTVASLLQEHGPTAASQPLAQQAVAVARFEALRQHALILLGETDTASRTLSVEERMEHAATLERMQTTLATMVTDMDLALSMIGGESQPMADSNAPAPTDDLTQLRGIGDNMQQRLNQAGIYTFVQVAMSTPEELRKAAGNNRQARVSDWIKQARELAGLP
ncbi:MAG: hypothetical protein MUD01_04910 [Chloroflexaceae bacterium]|jgi:predicted flap endonuclease-1-like 5' DNA nuclease|nr:hypothetical protein [Chloroflexaceae bacterium]